MPQRNNQLKTDKIFIITGPSGAGEDSVIEGLHEYFDISRIITTVTRPKRDGESDGNPYYFITNGRLHLCAAPYAASRRLSQRVTAPITGTCS